MKAFNKILIIRFSSLGDIILASPLIRNVRTTYPNAEIDFLVKSEYADVVKFNPHLSNVIELKTNEKEELRWLKEEIRRRRYDLIIDIHNSLRSRYLRLFTGGRFITSVNKRVIRRFLLVNFKWNIYHNTLSTAERYLETVKRYGVNDDGNGSEIFLPKDTITTTKSIMERFKLEKYDIVLGIAPTARHFTKRWLPERFVEFGVEFSKQYLSKMFIFGTKEEHDYCEDIAQMMNTRAGTNVAENLAGKLTFLETAAALDYCKIVVTNDSGLMHLAGARKKKVVAIFGSTVKEFGFFPHRTEHIVVEKQNVTCRPCSHIGLASCPKKHFRCMKDISVDDLFDAVNQMVRE
ncbi:MAG: lipopolysaccharide heptosyltransferase II [Bacteroidota bacterium]|nr:lipopolysaccharide heptosyltransferase II [Bacteroidota bacterium]